MNELFITSLQLHNCLRGARLTKFRGASMLWKPITSGR